MATQKDVTDMLNLNTGQQQQQQQKGGSLTKILKKDRSDESIVFVKKRHRPKGCIGREIEQLKQSSLHIVNDAQPSLVPDYSGKAGEEEGNEDGLKKKRSLVPVRGGDDESGEGRGTKWIWKGFTNPARGDHDKTVFYHWVPSTDVNDEYEFARFNKKAPVITYTKDEYRNLLTGPEASDYGRNVFTNEDEDEDFEYYDVTSDEDIEGESEDDSNNDNNNDSNDGESDTNNSNANDNGNSSEDKESSEKEEEGEGGEKEEGEKVKKDVNDDDDDDDEEEDNGDTFVKNSRKRKRPKKERKSITARFSDTNWTEKETDKLFELCERFDLRWVVITDRWNTDVLAENGGDESGGEGGIKSDSQGLRLYNPRTMEELKGRYYHVASKIASAHKLPKANPYISYKFNIKNEVRRKALLNRLHRRTADEVKEEEELIEILQRIDQRLQRGNKSQDQAALSRKSSTNNTGNDAQGYEDEEDEDDYGAGEGEIEYESTEPRLKRLKLKRIFLNRPYMRSQIQYAPKAPKEVENELEVTYNARTVIFPTQRSMGKYMELRGTVQKKQELERLTKQKEQLISLLKPSYERLSNELESLKKRAENRKRRVAQHKAEAASKVPAPQLPQLPQGDDSSKDKSGEKVNKEEKEMEVEKEKAKKETLGMGTGMDVEKDEKSGTQKSETDSNEPKN